MIGMRPQTVHATAIAMGGHAALIRGPSGAGKSDLALRCITSSALLGGRPLQAALVADDRVALRRDGPRLIASAPETIAGRLEVRGIGIIALPTVTEAAVALVVDLDPASSIERMPAPEATLIEGVSLPLLRLSAFEASSHLKLLLALAQSCDSV